MSVRGGYLLAQVGQVYNVHLKSQVHTQFVINVSTVGMTEQNEIGWMELNFEQPNEEQGIN